MERLGMAVRGIGRKTSLLGVDINFRDFPEVYSRYQELAGHALKHPAWGMGAKDYLDAVVTGKHPMSQAYDVYSDGGQAAFIASAVSEYRKLAAEAILADPKFVDLRKVWEQKKAEKEQAKLPRGVSLPAGLPSGLPSAVR